MGRGSSGSHAERTLAAVITVSDSCTRRLREDISGPRVAALLVEHGFTVHQRTVVEDDHDQIANMLRVAAAECALVVTTGGTGLTERDVTPEATASVCTRLLDGLAERMRAEGVKETPFAALSRGVSGQLGHALVVNLPGSPRGAETSLLAVLPVLPHAIALIRDPRTDHAADLDGRVES